MPSEMMLDTIADLVAAMDTLDRTLGFLKEENGQARLHIRAAVGELTKAAQALKGDDMLTRDDLIYLALTGYLELIEDGKTRLGEACEFHARHMRRALIAHNPEDGKPIFGPHEDRPDPFDELCI